MGVALTVYRTDDASSDRDGRPELGLVVVELGLVEFFSHGGGVVRGGWLIAAALVAQQ